MEALHRLNPAGDAAVRLSLPRHPSTPRQRTLPRLQAATFAVVRNMQVASSRRRRRIVDAATSATTIGHGDGQHPRRRRPLPRRPGSSLGSHFS